MSVSATPDLSGRTALVTGAGGGIGRATALRLAGAGARVVLAGRGRTALEETAAAMAEAGGASRLEPFDVGDWLAFEDAVARAEAALGPISVLVNNAGTIDPIARLADSDPASWSASLRTNVIGVYHGLRAVLPRMTARGEGTIVNISSGAANSALEGWSAYCASKAAAKKLTECAHAEAGDHGVRVIGLSPGTVATPMMAKIKKSGLNPVSRLDWSSHIPPDWAARAVLYLCGPGGDAHRGTDFSIKTDEGRRAVGLPTDGERAG